MQSERLEAGFTLVEITLVMAIASFLAIIAFQGFRALQVRQRFDASVAQELQNLNFARNYAISNVNDTGTGNSKDTALVGVSMEFQNDHIDNGHELAEMEPIYAELDHSGQPDMTNLAEMPFGPDTSECNPAASDDGDECWERYFPISDDLRITSGSTDTIIVMFVKTAEELQICHEVSDTYVSLADACADTSGSTFDFDISDSKGYTATIEVNGKNGTARRVQ